MRAESADTATLGAAADYSVEWSIDLTDVISIEETPGRVGRRADRSSPAEDRRTTSSGGAPASSGVSAA
jgi:hypothetical protein